MPPIFRALPALKPTKRQGTSPTRTHTWGTTRFLRPISAAGGQSLAALPTKSIRTSSLLLPSPVILPLCESARNRIHKSKNWVVSQSCSRLGKGRIGEISVRTLLCCICRWGLCGGSPRTKRKNYKRFLGMARACQSSETGLQLPSTLGYAREQQGRERERERERESKVKSRKFYLSKVYSNELVWVQLGKIQSNRNPWNKSVWRERLICSSPPSILKMRPTITMLYAVNKTGRYA